MPTHTPDISPGAIRATSAKCRVCGSEPRSSSSSGRDAPILRFNAPTSRSARLLTAVTNADIYASVRPAFNTKTTTRPDTTTSPERTKTTVSRSNGFGMGLRPRRGNTNGATSVSPRHPRTLGFMSWGKRPGHRPTATNHRHAIHTSSAQTTTGPPTSSLTNGTACPTTFPGSTS